jgi:hypothetical protein
MIRRATATLATVLLLVVLLESPPATAQEEPGPENLESISMELVIPRNEEVPPQLQVTLTDAAGQPVSGVEVDFTRELEFLGTTRYAELGTSETDVGGVARLVVLPREETATVIASVEGSEVNATLDVVFPDDRVDPFFDAESEPGRLEPLRDLMPTLIAAAVALLWVFVIGLAVSTVRRIKHAADPGDRMS